MKRSSAWLVWALLCFVGAVPCVAQLGRAIAHPEAMAGPWETTVDGEVIGMFLQLTTHTNRLPDDATPRPHFLEQLQCLLYRSTPSGKLENRLYFMAGPTRGLAWDGQHLRGDWEGAQGLPAVHVDLTWNGASHLWKGTLLRDGRGGSVVLHRPTRSSPRPDSSAVGTWSSSTVGANNCIHIAQAADGSYRAWSDQVRPLGLRYAAHIQPPATLIELYGVSANIQVNPSGLIDLELFADTPGCCSHRHLMKLAAHGRTLLEGWHENRPDVWRRMPGESCLPTH